MVLLKVQWWWRKGNIKFRHITAAWAISLTKLQLSSCLISWMQKTVKGYLIYWMQKTVNDNPKVKHWNDYSILILWQKFCCWLLLTFHTSIKFFKISPWTWLMWFWSSFLNHNTCTTSILWTPLPSSWLLYQQVFFLNVFFSPVVKVWKCYSMLVCKGTSFLSIILFKLPSLRKQTLELIDSHIQLRSWETTFFSLLLLLILLIKVGAAIVSEYIHGKADSLLGHCSNRFLTPGDKKRLINPVQHLGSSSGVQAMLYSPYT